jgi:hypothetical protein
MRPMQMSIPMPQSTVGATYHANVPIHCRYSFVCAGFEQLAGDEFLQSNDDAIFASYPHCCASILHGLDGVFDLFLVSLAASVESDLSKRDVPESYGHRGRRRS